MDLQDLATQAAAHFADDRQEGPRTVVPLPGLALLRHDRPTELSPSLYQPVVCLILQGSKETMLGDDKVVLAPGQALVVSHDVPVVSRITTARKDRPYLAMIVGIDVSLLRSLYDEVGEAVGRSATTRSMVAHPADSRLIDSLSRYLALASDPVEARVMGPLLRKEIHFRLLMAPHGGMLRALLRHDSHASSIARAIAHIRREYRGALAVPELARDVGMSPSSFHKHFKDITATTPLQYQKELRLLEARRLLASGEHTVSTVAFDVGYESPNQFSREYARKFGVSPRQHLAVPAA